MLRYALKRLLLVVPTLVLVTVFVFGIVRAIPGDVVDMMLEQFQYGKDAAELRPASASTGRSSSSTSAGWAASRGATSG